MGLDLRGRQYLVGTYGIYSTIFPLHLGMFVFIHIRIWWVSGMNGNSP